MLDPTVARRILSLTLLLSLLAAVASAQAPPCRFQPATAVFAVPVGGTIEPGPDPFGMCLYHLHRLTAPANSASHNADVSLFPSTPPGVYSQAARFLSVPADLLLLFSGSGGPASLRLEYLPGDVPAWSVPAAMRVYVTCPDRADEVPPVWCMPDATHELDLVAHTVTAPVLELPGWAAALPKIIRIDTPSDWSFFKTTPIEIRGTLDDFNLRAGKRTGHFLNFSVALTVAGTTPPRTYAPPVVAATGAWTELAAALDENENTVSAWVTDPAGDRSFDRITVVLDTIAPAITLGGVGEAAHVRGPVVLTAAEIERWPDTHTLAGARLLVPFLGEPGETEAIARADADLALTAETPPDARTLASPPDTKDGAYDLTFTSSDRAGNVGDARRRFTIDTVPPVVILGGVDPGAFERHTPVLTLSATDRNLASVSLTATLDGAPTPLACVDTDPDVRLHVCTAPAADEGLWVVTAVATDHAGNTTGAPPLSFTVDRTRPVFTLTGVDADQYRPDPFTVTVNISDANRDPAHEQTGLARDGLPVAQSTDPIPTFEVTDEGAYELTVTATDRAGNWRTETFAFGLDLTDPVIAIAHPTDGASTGDPLLAVRGSVDDRFTATVVVDPGSGTAIAAAFTGATWLAPEVPLAVGANVVTVTVTDRAGRTASASITVTRDGDLPEVAIASPADGWLTTAAVTPVHGTAADEHLAEVRLGATVLPLAPGATEFAVDASYPLVEGPNAIQLTARDVTGNQASTTVTVTRDSRCDHLVITAPGDGHTTAYDAISVTGYATDRNGIAEVTVGGLPATRSGDAFAVTVPLVDGPNTITSRAIDTAGNACVVTTVINRDRTGPRLVTATPADGATEVDLELPLVLDFSEPVVLGSGLAVSVPGTAMTVTATRILYYPTGGWLSDTVVAVEVTAAVRDRYGNPLQNPNRWTFRTVDRSPPADVILADLPAATSQSEIEVCGKTDRDVTVVVDGGTTPLEVAVDPSGHFCMRIGLEPNALNQLAFRARDAAGNVGAASIAYIRQETVRPVVVSATLTIAATSYLTVVFSKPMDPATVTDLEIVLEDGVAARSRNVVYNAGSTSAAVTSDDLDLAVSPFILTVTTAATDAVGNPLAFRFAKAFNTAGGDSIVVGEVYDAGTGLLLPGAVVEVLAIAGVETSDPSWVGPVPSDTTEADGGFALLLGDIGLVWARATKVGYVPGYRAVELMSVGLSTPVFDFRLSPLAADVLTVPASGGSLRAGAMLVTFPPGLPPATRLQLTELPQQGLPARLPVGWSPVFAVDLAVAAGVSDPGPFPGPATLRVPNRHELTPGDAVQIVRFDVVSREWIVGVPPAVATDGASLIAAVDGLGSYAFVRGDVVPVAPPPAIIGAQLPAVAVPLLDARINPSMEITPGTIFPAGRAHVRVQLGPVDSMVPMTSGWALQVDFTEELTLVDESRVELRTHTADVTSFIDGTDWPLMPQQTPGLEVFKEGKIAVRVYEFPKDVPSGGVIGPKGGTFSAGDWSLAVPSGAVDGATPVLLDDRIGAALPLPLFAGAEAVRAVDVSFGGASLLFGATLSVDATGRGFDNDDRFILVRVAEVLDLQRWVYVAAAAYDEASARVVTTTAGPGVRMAGLHAFLHIATPFAYIEGIVRDTTPRNPRVDGALVVGWAGGPVGVTYDRGQIATVAPIPPPSPTGPALVPIFAESPFTHDTGSVETAVGDGDTVTVLIQLEVSPPHVKATEPGNGAVNVPRNQSILFTFSERVDPVTLAGGIQVTVDGVPVRASVLATRGGQQAIFDPVLPFPANATVTFTVTAAIRDLSGHPCVVPASPWTFRTIDTVPPPPPSSGDVVVWAPDVRGQICVHAPVLADVTTVTATNVQTGFSLTLARKTGKVDEYAGCLVGDYGHTIRVSFLDAAGNVVSEDHTLFRERDAAVPTVRVGPSGGTFVVADADGAVAVTVPATAYAESVNLAIDPKPLAELAAAGFTVKRFAPVAAFHLAATAAAAPPVGTSPSDPVTATADLQIRVDPGKLVLGPDDALFLVRIIELRGKLYPELVAQMELDPTDGKLVTRLPAITVDTAPTSLALDGLDGLGPGAPAATDAESVPGMRRSGDHVILFGQALNAEVAYSMAHAPGGVVGLASASESWPDFAYQAYLADSLLIFPVPAGVEFDLEIYDPRVGRTTFRRRHPPIDVGRGATDNGPVEEQTPLAVSTASPLKTWRFGTSRFTEYLTPRIVAAVDPKTPSTASGVPAAATFPITVTGVDGAVAGRAWVRILDLVNGNAAEATASDTGAFALAAIETGFKHELLFTVETRELPSDIAITLELSYSVLRHQVEAGVKLYPVDDANDPIPLSVTGSGRWFVLTPKHQLAAGTGFVLDVGLDTKSGLPSGAMANHFVGRFSTRTLTADGRVTLAALADPNDLAKVGSYVFVAAGAAGLQIFDFSNPTATKPTLVGTHATPGAARAVGLFYHGSTTPTPKLHVAVAGGGSDGLGYMRILDVSDAAKVKAPQLVWAEFASGQVGAPSPENMPPLGSGMPLRLRTVETTVDGKEADLGFLAVVGLGLEIWDLTRMATAAPGEEPPISGPPARGESSVRAVIRGNDIFDVALYEHEWLIGLGPDGEPLMGSKLVAVVPRSAKLELYDVAAPGAPAVLGSVELAGTPRAVVLYPLMDYEIEGKVEPHRLALVAAQGEGVWIVDITDPTKPMSVRSIPVPGKALDIIIDSEGKRIAVNLGLDGVVVIDLSRPFDLTIDPADLIIGHFKVAGANFNTGMLADFSMGTIYASAEGKGVHQIRLDPPRPRFVTPEAVGVYAEWSDIVPLGVEPPATPPTTTSAAIALKLPGGIPNTVYVAIEPVDAYGQPMRDPSWNGIKPGIGALKLTRQSEDKLSELNSIYLSEPIAFTALAGLTDATHVNVVGGDRIHCRLLDDQSIGAPADAADFNWLGADLPLAHGSVRSWPMEYQVGPKPPPAAGASTGSGDILNTFLHSGEFFWNETDLAVAGRGIDFAWRRSHHSQAIYNGPLGRGWDSPYLARVHTWPDGHLVFYPGNGALHHLALRKNAAGKVVEPGQFGPEQPIAIAASQHATGYTLTAATGNRAHFNVEGDLVALTDLYGNTIELVRGADGRLRTIIDTLERSYTVSWNPAGQIESIVDPIGRTIRYDYDPNQNLASRTIDALYAVEYEYEPTAEPKNALKVVRNEKNEAWVANTYAGGLLTGQQWGDATDKVGVDITPGAGLATITDRRGNVTIYTHDAAGRLKSMREVADGDDPTTQYGYDSEDRLASVTYPEGNSVKNTYELAGEPPDFLRVNNVEKIERSPGPRGGAVESVSFTYDVNNRVLSQVDERGHQTTFARNDQGDPTVITAPRGAKTAIQYDKQGRTTRVTDAEGGVTVTEYSDDYTQLVTVDPGGLAVVDKFEFDSLSRLHKHTNAAGMTETVEYDLSRDLVILSKRNGGIHFDYRTNYEYDVRGPRTVTRFELKGAGTEVKTVDTHDRLGFRTTSTVTGSELPAALITTWTPTPNRTVEKVTHPGGATETFGYDKRDRVIKVTRAGAGGAPTTFFERGYDKNGNLLWESSPRDPKWKTTTLYDGHDRPFETTSLLGRITKRAYFPGGLAKTVEVLAPPADPSDPMTVIDRSELEYDDLGFVKVAEGGIAPAWEESFVTDKLGRVKTHIDRLGQESTSEWYPTGWLKSATDPLLNRVDYAYHKLGGVEKETRTDATGTAAWKSEYDGLGRRTKASDPSEHTTGWTYDSADNVIVTTDALGKQTAYTYDALGRLVLQVGPLGEAVRQVFDEPGNLREYHDANGNVTKYDFDGLSRRTGVKYPGLNPYVYTFTATDQVETETTPRGFVSTNTYDKEGRLEQRAVTNKDGDPEATETYSWDLRGRMLTAANAAATVVRTYDGNDRVLTEAVTIAGFAERTLTREFDVAGNLTSLLYPGVGGRKLDLAPDALGRWDTIKEGGGSLTLVDYDYAGPDRVKTKKVGSAFPLVSTFGYDGERMLASIDRVSGGRKVVDLDFGWTVRHELEKETNHRRRSARDAFDYDDAGRLVDASYVVPDGKPIADARRGVGFTLDKVRNVTERADRVGGPYQSERAATVTTGNRYGEVAGTVLEYDGDGNFEKTADGVGRLFTWDWSNRLQSVEVDGVKVAYQYDPLGRKVLRAQGTDVDLFWYDGWSLIQETDGLGAVSFEVLNGRSIDEPLIYWAGGAAGVERRVMQDRHGSVTAITDEVGKLLEAYEYTPDGRARRQGPIALDHARWEAGGLVLRFTGEVDFESAKAAVTLAPVPTDVEWEVSEDGRELRFTVADPTDWPAAVSVTVKATVRSVLGLELETAREFSLDTTDPADRVLQDWTAPKAEQVVQQADTAIRVVFSEAVKEAGLGDAFFLRLAAKPDLIAYTATRAADHRTVVVTPTTPLIANDSYILELKSAAVHDLADQPAPSQTWTWTATDKPTRIWDQEEPTAAPTSLFANRFFFQGHELDPVTGLYDFRNRWYDAGLGRWLSRDPLGYPDGPNQYAAFLGNPVGFADPSGLVTNVSASISRYDVFESVNGEIGNAALDYSLVMVMNDLTNTILGLGNIAVGAQEGLIDLGDAAGVWLGLSRRGDFRQLVDGFELSVASGALGPPAELASLARLRGVMWGQLRTDLRVALGNAATLFEESSLTRRPAAVRRFGPGAAHIDDPAFLEAPRSPLGVDVSYPDPTPSTYRNGLTPDTPVVDHKRARALGGDATDPANQAIRAWSENSRKGWHEGEYLRVKREYMRHGLSEEAAEWALEDYRRWFETDIHATPVDPSVLDTMPSR